MKPIVCSDYKMLKRFYEQNELEVSCDIVGNDNPRFSVCCEDNGSIVAAATLSQRQGNFILDYIAVDSSFRRKGVGRVLFDEILQKAKNFGADKIFITARNPAFFKSLGFVEGNPSNMDMNDDCVGCPQYKTTCVSVPMVLNLD